MTGGVVETSQGRAPADRRPPHSQILFSRDAFFGAGLDRAGRCKGDTVRPSLRGRREGCAWCDGAAWAALGAWQRAGMRPRGLLIGRVGAGVFGCEARHG